MPKSAIADLGGASPESITPVFPAISTGVMDSGQPLRGFRNDHREFFSSLLHSVQRRAKVVGDVVGMFEAGRQSHQAVADAKLGALRRRQPLMRRGGRMRDQALG